MTAPGIRSLDIKRLAIILLGVVLFALIHYSPPWAAAIDPAGKHFPLSSAGKGALAIFLLAGVYWVSEVVPIGVTSLLVGILQALCMVRPAKDAFRDFMDPAVMFVFASVVIGMVFTKTGLSRRVAYKMLLLVGEQTRTIYLGSFAATAVLTLVMAHTAVAATIYPLLLAIYSLYGEGDRRTRFGKGLFIGMAYVAGAGSIVTMLGSARAVVSLGFFREIAHRELGFFEFSYYMLPVGWSMILLLWPAFLLVCRPEKAAIPGLRRKAQQLNRELGRVTRNEILAAAIVLGTLVVLSLRAYVSVLAPVDTTALMLMSTVLFFGFNILTIDDLEHVPWNILLLFGGAMSIGLCLFETGAATWLAVRAVPAFQQAGPLAFIMCVAFVVMVMTNFIMNVAAVAITLPVALVIAPYVGVNPAVILLVSLITAGMPFVSLIGAAPNAMAYDSKQFTVGEFFLYGLLASGLLMAVLVLAVTVIWPAMGMPIRLITAAQ